MPTQEKPCLQWMGKQKNFCGRHNLHLHPNCHFQVLASAERAELLSCLQSFKELTDKTIANKFQLMPYEKVNIYNKMKIIGKISVDNRILKPFLDTLIARFSSFQCLFIYYLPINLCILIVRILIFLMENKTFRSLCETSFSF